MGYTSWGCKKLDMTQQLNTQACLKMEVLVAQSGPTLCNPKDCSSSVSSVCGIFSDKNMGVGSHSLLQGISPTQGLNLGLPQCRQILYCQPPARPTCTSSTSFLKTSLQVGPRQPCDPLLLLHDWTGVGPLIQSDSLSAEVGTRR